MADLVFVSLGEGNVVCANNIYAIIPLRTAQSQRLLQKAKKDDMFLDWTGHRRLKCMVFLTNGIVIGCFFSAATIFKRLNRATSQTLEDSRDDCEQYDDEEDDEDESELD